MQSHSHQSRLFPLGRLIPRAARRFLRSPSFATGVLVLVLLLMVILSILLLAPWWESFTALSQQFLPSRP